MTYDEQHGWVERGTAGVRSGAVVDVDAEIAALDRIHAAPPTIDPKWLRSELAFGSTAREAMAQGAINSAREVEVARQRESEMRRGARRAAHHYAGFDVGLGASGTVMTFVDGSTLHINTSAVLPPRTQTIIVNVTVGDGK